MKQPWQGRIDTHLSKDWDSMQSTIENVKFPIFNFKSLEIEHFILDIENINA